MKQNNRNRRNGHFGSRSARPAQTIYRNTVLESTGPCGKLRGTPLQLAEKYQAAAKDALVQNDTVLAEALSQYADHYMRLQNQAIENEKANNAYKSESAPVSEPAEVVSEEPDIDADIKSTEDLSVPVQQMQVQDLESTPDPIQQ